MIRFPYSLNRTIVNNVEKTVQLKSDWGIVSSGYKNLSAETMPLVPSGLVIICTDGVAEKIDMSGYDKVLRADVSQLSEKILKDRRHKTDDVAILISLS
ncbi:unnamed protein product [marine sediment metagenome]|uniref:PPM-type phosphatase domain-containing protein n=1 Tax=marine sediment metagenome TaxID=412755 RepID=X1PCT3_9ZZZZ